MHPGTSKQLTSLDPLPLTQLSPTSRSIFGETQFMPDIRNCCLISRLISAAFRASSSPRHIVAKLSRTIHTRAE